MENGKIVRDVTECQRPDIDRERCQERTGDDGVGRPAKVAFPYSSRDSTTTTTRDWQTGDGTSRLTLRN